MDTPTASATLFITLRYCLLTFIERDRRQAGAGATA